MFEWLYVLLFTPMAFSNAPPPTTQDFVGVVAAEAAYTTLLPASPVKPAPKPGDICPNCNGVGKVGDSTVMSTCKPCKGTGRVLPPEQVFPLRELPPPAPPAFKPAPVQSVPSAPRSSSCPTGTCPTPLPVSPGLIIRG